MIHNMFVGDPAGDYDRVLDFSTAVTGTTFFVPSNDRLESLGSRTTVSGLLKKRRASNNASEPWPSARRFRYVMNGPNCRW
jgi:hypothetical protein